MDLYHFSEQPGIERFEPRSVVAERPPGREWLNEPLVWAIDGWHSPMYFFPRECPRILAWSLPTTTPGDRGRWLGESGARMAAWVEDRWLDRLRAARLYRYTFDASGFEPLDDAGMWVSRGNARPIAEEPIDGLPARLRDAGVELRVLPSLLPLRDLWQTTTLHVSGIRLRNAQGWT